MRIVLMTAIYPGARIGGAEYQTSLLGKELVRRGHEVMYLALEARLSGHSAPVEERCEEGLRIREIPGWRVNGRVDHDDQVERILREFEPEVCYLRYFLEISDISRVCRKLGIPLISVGSSFMETSPFFTERDPRNMLSALLNGNMLLHWKSFWAIRRLAAHVCNTLDTATRIRRWLSESRILTIYNGSLEPPESEIHRTPGRQIIWVNNFKRLKRPEQFVELARRLPEYQFVMIGALPGKGRYAEACRQLLSDAPQNLTYLGGLPIEQVNQHIADSDLLVYTSKADTEGFGNSLLQAWFRAVPTVCLDYNIDGIMTREGIGSVAHSMDEFVAQVRESMESTEARMAMGGRARAFALAHHRVEIMADQYEALFREIREKSDIKCVAGELAE